MAAICTDFCKRVHEPCNRTRKQIFSKRILMKMYFSENFPKFILLNALLKICVQQNLFFSLFLVLNGRKNVEIFKLADFLFQLSAICLRKFYQTQNLRTKTAFFSANFVLERPSNDGSCTRWLHNRLSKNLKRVHMYTLQPYLVP